MQQLLALEWDSREVRVAVASGRGRQVVIEQAFSVLWNEDPSLPDPPEVRLGRRIAQELSQRGLGHPEVLVAVGRGSIELRQLQLPPAPDEDLPEMVRFQAAREFNELDEHWLLDFVPIDQASGGPRTVLATAIAPAMIGQIEAVCREAGLKMRRLLLRPCEAASLLGRDKTGKPGQLRLLVDLFLDEADLIAVLDGKAVFLRTTRLASDPPAVPALLAEIRLTMAAVQNQLGGQRVQSIVLCGRDAVHAELARAIEAELELQAELFDPFSGFRLAPALENALPEHTGRFAPLLGMLATESQQAGHAIDFLHPRRRIEAPSRRRKWIIAGAVAAMVPLVWLIWSRIDGYLLASDVDRLQAESKSLDEAIAAAKKVRGATAEIRKWADTEVVWLDQLEGLTESFPPAEDAVLGQLTLRIGQGGSQIDLKGWVRDAEVIAKMEDAVRARAGQIQSKSSREDSSMKPYSWRFETSVLLQRGAKP